MRGAGLDCKLCPFDIGYDRINVVEWPLDPAVCCYPIASFAHAFV